MLRRCLLSLAMTLSIAFACPLAAADSVDALARDVGRLESLRAVKTLQRTYSQYAQFGLWTEAAGLFARDARFIFADQATGELANGQAEIALMLRRLYGSGQEGVPRGGLSTMMIETPVVNLAVDGESAKGRWHVLIFFTKGGQARIEGGIFENDYVREGGVWKIATAHYFPQYAGSYEDGWTNWGGSDLPIVPYHFDTDTAGIPVPPAQGAAPKSGATLASLTHRINALNDEDRVRNLQAMLGFYLDRKMWDDVADLFADESAVEIGGLGVWRGKAGVRRWLATMGPAGLRHGQLNDQVQFDVTVTIAPGGNEAWARGIELGMLGEADQEKGSWQISAFRNRFVKEAGVWKLREMRRFPILETDYFIGWGRSRIVRTAPTGDYAPDVPASMAEFIKFGQLMPAFAANNPVTGKPVSRAGSLQVVASTPLTGRIAFGATKAATLAEARRRLARSLAYDGVINVSSAYGDYLDDFNSPAFSALLADKGFKVSAFAGYYVGRDRVEEAGKRVWGPVPETRPGISYHWRVQPVLLINADGTAVDGHIRLFQPRTGKTVGNPGDFYGAAFWGGIYHDQFVLERGSWRFWNLSLDEPYITPVGWKGGWAMAKDPPPPDPNAPVRAASSLTAETSTFKPDIPYTALGKRQEHFRGGTGEAWQWPQILPMWFEYTNPVSGRVPEHHQTECVPCAVRPDLRLDANGFPQPPDGPEANRSEDP